LEPPGIHPGKRSEDPLFYGIREGSSPWFTRRRGE